jgi:hypothetical protein
MKGSGKQILLRVLRELSSKKIPNEDLCSASERVRAALLLHGSSSKENFEKAISLKWSVDPLEGDVERQGLAAQDERVFLSDFFERMLEMPGIEEFMVKSYQGFKGSDYDAAIWALWALVTAPQMYSELQGVEVEDSELELENWLQNYIEKLDYFRRENGGQENEK